ncbi:MAG: alpha/beta fold hydrolase [Burkholderiales bacterium]
MPLAQVNGTEIWYEVKGTGEPIILLPGLGLDHGYYRIGEPLLRQEMKTIVVDPRGIGQSRKDAPDKVHYTPELWADDFAALVDQQGLAPVHVLGSSLGGCMAMSFADRHPKLVKSLICVGAFSELDRALYMNFNLRKKIIARCGMGEEIADFMGLFTMSREYLESDAGYQVMQGNQVLLKNNSPELYRAFLDSILWWGRKLPGQESTPLFTTRLKGFRCPTLVVSADNDYFIPAKFSRIIADNVPGAQYIEVSGGGHIPFIERPNESAEAVLRFIRSLAK